jgi:hypothetical protein
MPNIIYLSQIPDINGNYSNPPGFLDVSTGLLTITGNYDKDYSSGTHISYQLDGHIEDYEVVLEVGILKENNNDQ